jgi:hypothetical protein
MKLKIPSGLAKAWDGVAGFGTKLLKATLKGAILGKIYQDVLGIQRYF